MFDKNLVLSYCREKTEAAHWASKQISSKKSPDVKDALASSALTGKVAAYNTVIKAIISKNITSQSQLATELVDLISTVKIAAQKNSAQSPSLEVALTGESFLGQAEAISDISDLLRSRFFEK